MNGLALQVQRALEDEALPAVDRKKLRGREKALLRAHEREWVGDWPELFPAPTETEGPYCGQVNHTAGRKYEFKRGLLTTVNFGALTVLRARMNQDLRMADKLKATGAGNLFVVFGEPDIDVATLDTGELQVTVKGVDVYDPNTGDIRSNDVRDIAAWFIDTDYNEESFFVRHAYFLGANDPYSALKTTLKAEINEEAWATLNSDTSRPFPKPTSGRIAVKVINHLGDEVMKVFRVD